MATQARQIELGPDIKNLCMGSDGRFDMRQLFRYHAHQALAFTAMAGRVRAHRPDLIVPASHRANWIAAEIAKITAINWARLPNAEEIDRIDIDSHPDLSRAAGARRIVVIDDVAHTLQTIDRALSVHSIAERVVGVEVLCDVSDPQNDIGITIGSVIQFPPAAKRGELVAA